VLPDNSKSNDLNAQIDYECMCFDTAICCSFGIMLQVPITKRLQINTFKIRSIHESSSRGNTLCQNIIEHFSVSYAQSISPLCTAALIQRMNTDVFRV
jgi:hypothetical protein